ncbi:cupin domain-containing protein [Candidatus Dojkabacteria bacterium]|nr:cupin domain-containing protein [Candidatus Dojkabacteria bacterium]
MRKPFKKNINKVQIEEAHGGSGRRQLLLSKNDPISSQLEAMTKGIIPLKGAYDWHTHENTDEFFLVTQGIGVIEFEDGTKIEYSKDDLIYIPSNTKHRIENTGKVENEFIFVRINQ